ncbi:MAG TPA: dephospho-CoA kinase [Clostridiales bacterium]|nr:dephospho-CoA kinase [Clostridiales bacterium]
MLVIGLTGGIASGKSTVSRVLKELGAPVIDADLVAKEVIRPGTEAWRELVETFGEDILNKDGTIDRRRLGDKVFADPEAVRRLNEITHPRILEAIGRRLEEYARLGEDAPPGVVIDAPLLIEAGMVDMVDEVWLVVVDQKTQIQRLMARDHFGVEQALNRINAQIPLEKKKRYADVIIDNTGSMRWTRAQVVREWKRVLEQVGSREKCPG